MKNNKPERPWMLLVYSMALVGVALSLPVQIHFLYEVPLSNFSELLNHMTWVNIIFLLLCLCTAYLAFFASRFAFIGMALTAAVLLFNNWWAGFVSTDYSMGEAVLGVLGFVMLHVIVLEKKAIAALRNKNATWRRAEPRVRKEFMITIFPWVGDPIRTSTYDISTSGAFLNLPTDSQLNVGDRMQMRVHVTQYRDLRFTAKLVRKGEAKGTYPNGAAVMFEDLGYDEKKVLKQALTS